MEFLHASLALLFEHLPTVHIILFFFNLIVIASHLNYKTLTKL